ncbi:MAG: peroxiredoxin [Flavobacteriaceae bacterium]
MLAVGEKLPGFDRVDQAGNRVTSDQFIGKQPLVLFFYPKNFTPGCTAEVCSFRDKYADFLEYGAQVIGVSSDSLNSHGKFSENYQLPYPLLSDADKSLQRAFKIKPQFFGILSRRVTFVFDQSGTLVLTHSGLNPVQHIYKALKTLQDHAVG